MSPTVGARMMQPVHNATVECGCGAKLTVNSPMVSAVNHRLAEFDAAHEKCRQASDEREALDEIERLRAAIVMAGRICAEAAGMQCECDGYYTCNGCPERIAECADEARELLADALTDDGPNWATS